MFPLPFGALPVGAGAVAPLPVGSDFTSTVAGRDVNPSLPAGVDCTWIGTDCDPVGIDCAEGAEGVVDRGGEFRGAPTSISQRCPGCPCGGLSPEAGVATVAFRSTVVDVDLPVSTVVAAAGTVGGVTDALTAAVSVDAEPAFESDSPQETRATAARMEAPKSNCLIVIKE